jgi:hypothetical protein
MLRPERVIITTPSPASITVDGSGRVIVSPPRRFTPTTNTLPLD